MVNLIEHKMLPGEYIEDKDIPALAEEYLEGNPIIKEYDWEIIDNGSRKNTLGFGVEYMDAKKAAEQYDADVFKDALSRVNKFLEAVTGRDADLRKKDMKDAAKGV